MAKAFKKTYLWKILYKGFLRTIHEYERNNIPCLLSLAGVSSTCSKHSLKELFKQGPFDEGAFNTLSVLRAKLEALRGAEQETRHALSCWNDLFKKYEGTQCQWNGPHPFFRCSHAAEDAAFLLSHLHDELQGWGVPLTTEEEAHWSDHGGKILLVQRQEAWQSGGEDRQCCAESLLDQRSREVGQQHPALFPRSHPRLMKAATEPLNPPAKGKEVHANASAEEETGLTTLSSQYGGPGIELLKQQLHAIARSLFQGPGKLKYTPVEWTYDGLAPLLLPDVLRRSKGVPLSIAIALSCMASRLGVPSVPVPVAESQQSATADQAVEEEQRVLLELAVRQQAGRATPAPPSPTAWMVLACPLMKSEGDRVGSISLEATSSTIYNSTQETSTSRTGAQLEDGVQVVRTLLPPGSMLVDTSYALGSVKEQEHSLGFIHTSTLQ
ncbi:hypothetical protein CEUSTIGMA_g11516.t1, partial [Chlamydomonas eustigma]